MNKHKIFDEFKKLVEQKSYTDAQVQLMIYWREIVGKDVQELSTWIYMNSLLPKSKRASIFEEESFKNTHIGIFSKLKLPIWSYIPKHVLKQLGRLKDASNYQPNPEDDSLKSLITPFLGNDTLYLPTMGVNFSKEGIVVTDKIALLYLHKVKKGEKGTYCFTKKCFDQLVSSENKIEQRYPDFQHLFANNIKGYNTPRTVDTDQARLFMKNILELKIAPFDNHVSMLAFGEKKILFADAKRLEIVFNTARKLGWDKTKIWYKGQTDPIVFTSENFTKSDFPVGDKKPKKDMILLMPVVNEFTVGMPVFDLEEKKMMHIKDDRKETLKESDKSEIQEAITALKTLHSVTDSYGEKAKVLEAIEAIEILL